jgi:glycosyltransferase involved in cell wall biosynthesis
MNRPTGEDSIATTSPRAAPDNPFISVILMASRHREFVRDAVDSIRRQTLDPREYELIVVHDYDDQSLERTVSEMGGRSVRVDPGSIGVRVRRGIDSSWGQVLAFLDDDDRFLSRKLATVHEKFRADEALGFFRNGYVVIDGSGRQQPHHAYRARQRRSGQHLGPFALRGRQQVLQMRGLPALGLDFNSSCMSIRRDLLRDFIRSMDVTEFQLLDELVFFAALASAQTLYVDPTILTEYRFHSQNWSLSPDFSRTVLPSYATLVGAARALGREDVAEEAESLLQINHAYGALRDPSTPKSQFVRLRRDLARRRSSYFVKCESQARYALWLFSISPRVGRWLYSRPN